MSSNINTKLSIVIPLFNEEEVFPLLLNELNSVCRGMSNDYEIIFVDDGSSDATFGLLEDASRVDHRIKVVRLSRNFGQQAAFNAGIDIAQGEMVAILDGDLQYPPSLIPTFLEYANQGYDIVLGERTANKQFTRTREKTGRFIYWLLRKITNLKFKTNVTDFGLYSRSVISILKRLPEKERFLRGMIQWVGFRKKYVPYVAGARERGIPKYTFRKLAGLIMSGVTSFSAFPLRLSFWLGILTFIASVGYGSFVVINHFINPNPSIEGWTTLVLLILFIGSAQLIVLGIIGEYLYRMFNEIKGRPVYIVKEFRNVDSEQLSDTPYGIRASHK